MKKTFLFMGIAMLQFVHTSLAQKNFSALIDKYLQAQVRVNEFSGVVLVADNNKVIYKKAFGYADREWKSLNTPETKFEIGSVTKQFTAVAILQLAEQGKLHVDDKLSMYFPGYPKGDSITIHMLLNHSSGIADFTSLPAFYPVHTLPLVRDSVISLFKNQSFTFSPGTKWAYSNSGYFLLGCIIEQVTKQDYRTYLYENVIKRAALKNTSANRLDSVLALRARGYSKTENNKWKNAEYFSMEIPFSAGSMISTVEDLYFWERTLLSGNIVSKDMLLKMTTPYLSNYGYGLRIDTFQQQVRILHTGTIPGFSSYLGGINSRGISIVILSNCDFTTDAIADAITATLFNLAVQLPYKPVERHINKIVLKRYNGKYQVGGTTNFNLLERDGKLYLKPEGGGEIELKPESETKFFFARDPSQEFEFIIDSKGLITNCFFINKGSKIAFKKLN
ncbi:MAG: serine hydrolase [Chitinophagaceae bacterium]